MEDMVVMVMYLRILLIRSWRLQMEWDVLLKDIQIIVKERMGLSLMLRGGMNGLFIFIGEESGRMFIYRMVVVVVEEFNRRFRGLEQECGLLNQGKRRRGRGRSRFGIGSVGIGSVRIDGGGRRKSWRRLREERVERRRLRRLEG